MRVIGGYIKNQWQRQSNSTLNLKYGQMPKQTTNENHYAGVGNKFKG